jgi:hypothetical protein
MVGYNTPIEQAKKKKDYIDFLNTKIANNKYVADKIAESFYYKELGMQAPKQPEKPTELQLQDFAAQQEIAFKNLNEITDSGSASNIILQLKNLDNTVEFNSYFPAFKEAVKGQTNITPIVFTELWRRFKDKLATEGRLISRAPIQPIESELGDLSSLLGEEYSQADVKAFEQYMRDIKDIEPPTIRMAEDKAAKTLKYIVDNFAKVATFAEEKIDPEDLSNRYETIQNIIADNLDEPVDALLEINTRLYDVYVARLTDASIPKKEINKIAKQGEPYVSLEIARKRVSLSKKREKHREKQKAKNIELEREAEAELKKIQRKERIEELEANVEARRQAYIRDIYDEKERLMETKERLIAQIKKMMNIIVEDIPEEKRGENEPGIMQDLWQAFYILENPDVEEEQLSQIASYFNDYINKMKQGEEAMKKKMAKDIAKEAKKLVDIKKSVFMEQFGTTQPELEYGQTIRPSRMAVLASGYVDSQELLDIYKTGVQNGIYRKTISVPVYDSTNVNKPLTYRNIDYNKYYETPELFYDEKTGQVTEIPRSENSKMDMMTYLLLYNNKTDKKSTRNFTKQKLSNESLYDGSPITYRQFYEFLLNRPMINELKPISEEVYDNMIRGIVRKRMSKEKKRRTSVQAMPRPSKKELSTEDIQKLKKEFEEFSIKPLTKPLTTKQGRKQRTLEVKEPLIEQPLSKQTLALRKRLGFEEIEPQEQKEQLGFSLFEDF